jgi:hypothetical protein
VRVVIATTIETDGVDRGRSIAALLAATQTINEAYLRANPGTPWLYEAGVRFDREPPELREEFACIPVVLKRGWGDCDDLAPWRAAELRVRRGLDAKVCVFNVGPGLWHAAVKLPNGRHEDPSRVLGMGGRA